MKRFVWKMALFAPILVLFFGVTIGVDPSGLFQGDQEQKIAAWMAEGYNITEAVNVDYRRVLKHYVGLIQKGPEVLVLGSSRAMGIDSSFFPGQSMYNASVPAAMLPDWVANYELFREHGFVPKKVLLGLDAHVFNVYVPSTMHLREEFARAAKRIGAPFEDNTPLVARIIDPRYAQIISPAYFQTGLPFLVPVLVKGRPEPQPTHETVAENKLVRADGSLVYEELRREILDQAAIDKKAGRYAEKHPEGLVNYRALDPRLCTLFERFVGSLRQDGVEVVFLITPFHPLTYSILMRNDAYTIIGDVEAYFRKVADANNITLYGSFDPDRCGFINTDFYDAVHSKPESIRRLLPNAS